MIPIVEMEKLVYLLLMMMVINVENLRVGFWRHFPLAAAVGVLIALEMAAVLMGGFRIAAEPVAMGVAPVQTNNTLELGKLIYTHYILPLEVAAAILLVAMIAAIALTLRARKDSKYVHPSEQVRVKAKDRMVLVRMEATRAGPEESDNATPAGKQV